MKKKIVLITHAYAGTGEYILNNLDRYSDIEVICLSGWEKSSFPQKESIPWIPIEELNKYIFDAVLIALPYMWHVRMASIMLKLKKMLISNIYVVNSTILRKAIDFDDTKDLFDSIYVEKVPNDEKPYLYHIDVHVCDYCNLNCKGCSHYAPFVKKAHGNNQLMGLDMSSIYDVNQFERDIQSLVRLLSGIGSITFMGGEPLMEPDLLCSMVGMTRDMFPDTEIIVFTNALLLKKMSSDFWSCMAENSCFFEVTLYPKFQNQKKDLENILDRYSINYDIKADENLTFATYLTLDNNHDVSYNHNNCAVTECFQMKSDIIGKCPTVMYSEYALGKDFWKKKFKTNNSGKVSLSAVEDGWELFEKLSRPCELCSYCDKKGTKRIPWETISGEANINDWMI